MLSSICSYGNIDAKSIYAEGCTYIQQNSPTVSYLCISLQGKEEKILEDNLPNPKKSQVAPEKLNIRMQIDWVNKSPTHE